MAQAGGYNETLGIMDGPVGDCWAEVRLRAGDGHLNPAGAVHGGAIMGLIDVAMGRAAASLSAGDELPATIEMKVNFLEPGRPGDIMAQARVLRRGRRFTVLLAEVWQADGHDAVAEAIGTFVTPQE